MRKIRLFFLIIIFMFIITSILQSAVLGEVFHVNKVSDTIVFGAAASSFQHYNYIQQISKGVSFSSLQHQYISFLKPDFSKTIRDFYLSDVHIFDYRSNIHINKSNDYNGSKYKI